MRAQVISSDDSNRFTSQAAFNTVSTWHSVGPDGDPEDAGQDKGRGKGVLDRATEDKPKGPWPASYHRLLAAWIKLEMLEYMGKKHESPISMVRDSAEHGALVVVAPFSEGATKIIVEVKGEFDLSDASEANPVTLVLEGTNRTIQAVGIHDNYLSAKARHVFVQPTSCSGAIRQMLVPMNSDVSQTVTDYQPIYRRNICNFMPSIRFAPEQFLTFQDHSVLGRRLSGPVESVDFTLFFVAKAYTSVGSSPWPVFTALDGETGWSYQVQVVIEQRAGVANSFEPRWKVQFGKYSEKTDGIDPTNFHIVTVIKRGRLVRLFVDGCSNGKPDAEFVVEDEGRANITYSLFGMDANGSKYFDGEIAEFLAYSSALQESQTTSIGKYLARRYVLPWSWKEPTEQGILDEFERHRAAQTHPKRFAQLAASGDGGAKVAKSHRTPLDEIKALIASLEAPEEALQAMERIAQLAADPKVQEAIIGEDPWDALFAYLESNQTPVKSRAVRAIYSLVKGNDDAHAEVMGRDGLFLLLKAAEPPWRVGLDKLLKEKTELVRKAEKLKTQLEQELKEVDEADVARTFQLNLQIRQSVERIGEAEAQVEGVRHRIDSGIERKNNLELQREALRGVATLCKHSPASKQLLLDLSGLLVLSRVLGSEALPVKSAVCEVIVALVVDPEMARELLAEELVADIVNLMEMDDPHLQCEAAEVLLLALGHPQLRTQLATQDLFRALYAMMASEHNDNYLGATRIIHVLAAHDEAMRARVVAFPGMLERIMSVALLPNLEIRQRAVQSMSFLAQNEQGVAHMWENGLEEAILALLEDSDVTVTTHTVMTMANAACSTEGARRLYTMDVISKVCLIGSRPEISLQHLAYGVLANLAVPPENHRGLLSYPALPFLVRMLSNSAFHARYNAAIAIRKLAINPAQAKQIVEAGALGPLIAIAHKPRVLLNPPDPLSVDREGRSLYLHWQASRAICALSVSPEVHLNIVREGGIVALIQLCESGQQELCREGASALAYLAEVRCETECLLKMAEEGAIEALQALAENPDDSTGSEAIRALSSLLNFDSAWAD